MATAKHVRSVTTTESVSHPDNCFRCDGSGRRTLNWVAGTTRECPECKGTGKRT